MTYQQPGPNNQVYLKFDIAFGKGEGNMQREIPIVPGWCGGSVETN